MWFGIRKVQRPRGEYREFRERRARQWTSLGDGYGRWSGPTGVRFSWPGTVSMSISQVQCTLWVRSHATCSCRGTLDTYHDDTNMENDGLVFW
jgi:hypothetical protein